MLRKLIFFKECRSLSSGLLLCCLCVTFSLFCALKKYIFLMSLGNWSVWCWRGVVWIWPFWRNEVDLLWTWWSFTTVFPERFVFFFNWSVWVYHLHKSRVCNLGAVMLALGVVFFLSGVFRKRLFTLNDGQKDFWYVRLSLFCDVRPILE